MGWTQEFSGKFWTSFTLSCLSFLAETWEQWLMGKLGQSQDLIEGNVYPSLLFNRWHHFEKYGNVHSLEGWSSLLHLEREREMSTLPRCDRKKNYFLCCWFGYKVPDSGLCFYLNIQVWNRHWTSRKFYFPNKEKFRKSNRLTTNRYY